MKQLVLISHGRLCEGMKDSAEMILGPQDNIHTVALLPEDGSEDFLQRFQQMVATLDDYVVFADLLGGTPCNVVSRLIMEGQDIELYAGMNLPMLIEYFNVSFTDLEERYVAKGQAGVVKVNDLLAGFDDDEDE